MIPDLSAIATIKSPGEYAFGELLKEFRTFQASLAETEELGILTGSGAGVTYVERVKCDGNLIVFTGIDELGRKVKVVQHYTQLNVQLVAVPKQNDEARRIGF